jgi:hypothetical protein
MRCANPPHNDKRPTGPVVRSKEKIATANGVFRDGLQREPALALERLARRYGVTKQTMMERLINAENERIMAQLSPDTPDWDAYVGK